MAERTSDERHLRAAKQRLLRHLVFGAAIFGLFLGGLFAYARTWPPMIAIDSNSMAHDRDVSGLGIVDTGDLLFMQAANTDAEIVTYLEGRGSGYSSYGDFGDVVVFQDPELLSPAFIVHRALADVIWNVTACRLCYDVPDLAPLPPADWDAWNATGAPASGPFGITRFTLHRAGWARDLEITFNATFILTRTSGAGLLTMGDRNVYYAPIQVDPWVVPLSAVVGVARAEVPWFGLIQLTIDPGPFGCCSAWGSTDPDYGAPENSWLALQVSLAILIAAPIVASIILWRLDRRRAERGRRTEGSKGPTVQ